MARSMATPSDNGDGQNQHVHIARPQFPVGPVKCQQLRAAELQHPHDQLRTNVTVQTDMLEEALKAAVIRRVSRVTRELAGQMREVHRPAVRQAEQKHSQGLEPRLAQVEMWA